MTTKNEISKAAAALGRKGGASKSGAKQAASAENGKSGGRNAAREWAEWARPQATCSVREIGNFDEWARNLAGMLGYSLTQARRRELKKIVDAE